MVTRDIETGVEMPSLGLISTLPSILGYVQTHVSTDPDQYAVQPSAATARAT